MKEILGLGKRLLKNFVCSFFPMKDEIILESHPDLACNTYELFRYMLSQSLNDRFQITWLVNNPDLYNDYDVHNVGFLSIMPKTKKDKMIKYFRCNRAKVLITCNRYYQKELTSKKQLNIYILHGSPVKNFPDLAKPLNCDFLISQADFFNQYIVEKFSVKPEQVVATGFPRNDQMFRNNDNLNKIYPDINSFAKVIAWVPTFRKHMNKIRIDCDYDFPLGIPILYSEEDVRKLNDFLVEKNVLIIYKPHPAQDLSILKDMHASNLRFLYNSQLAENDIQTNEFLSQTDAMVGDYSGIYYDYLLLDRPIGITLDDYTSYESQSGMVFGLNSDILIGENIYTLEDLERFIDDVVNGKDRMYKEREKIKLLTNKHIGIGASEELYSFIMEEYKKRFKA